MRKVTILGAAVALALAPTAAFAQQAPAQPPAAATPAPADPAAPPAINTITVVDIEELPTPAKTAVEEAVAKSSEADLQQLRATVDATPSIKSALDAKGVTSDQVVAATMGQNGALTVITKKPS